MENIGKKLHDMNYGAVFNEIINCENGSGIKVIKKEGIFDYSLHFVLFDEKNIFPINTKIIFSVGFSNNKLFLNGKAVDIELDITNDEDKNELNEILMYLNKIAQQNAKEALNKEAPRELKIEIENESSKITPWVAAGVGLLFGSWIGN